MSAGFHSKPGCLLRDLPGGPRWDPEARHSGSAGATGGAAASLPPFFSLPSPIFYRMGTGSGGQHKRILRDLLNGARFSSARPGPRRQPSPVDEFSSKAWAFPLKTNVSGKAPSGLAIRPFGRESPQGSWRDLP